MDGESALIIAKLLQEDLDGSDLWIPNLFDPSNTNSLIGELAEIEMMSSADAAFARKLQALYDDGTAANNVTGTALLGEDFWKRRSNAKGKAKGEKSPEHYSEDSQDDLHVRVKVSPNPLCLSCLETFDVRASLSLIEPVATSKILYGRFLSCPQKHPFCYPCLQRFVEIELAKALQGETVFPIRCPVCPGGLDWDMGEDEAALFLNADDLRKWRRILDLESRSKFYCPERSCSQLFYKIEGQTQMRCPRCHLRLCSDCGSKWHDGLNCEQYESLSDHERSPEDLIFFTVMLQEKWRRCPKCGIVIERGEGCRHMTCRCKTQFCYRCGSLWDFAYYRCGSNPPCALYSEDELLRHDMAVRGPVQPEEEGVEGPFAIQAIEEMEEEQTIDENSELRAQGDIPEEAD